MAMSLIPFFGDGHLLWASDYPHPDSVWPNSQQAIERQMRHLSLEMRRKLTHDNAAALYGLGRESSSGPYRTLKTVSMRGSSQIAKGMTP